MPNDLGQYRTVLSQVISLLSVTLRELRCLGSERREVGLKHPLQQVGSLRPRSADNLAEFQAPQADAVARG
jgi:hypothetical protein